MLPLLGLYRGQRRKAALSAFQPDGDSGFPGDLTVVITYTLTDDNTLVWESEASTLTETICCLTNHSYFNLNGCDSGSTEGQYLTINSDYILEIDEEMLPTGGFFLWQEPPSILPLLKSWAANATRTIPS
mgnify:CR=1 FL=1